MSVVGVAVVAVVVVYPWCAGRLYRYLAPPSKPERPHRRESGPYSRLACVGPRPSALGSDSRCAVCDRVYKARRAAWLWPLWCASRPFVSLWRLGAGTSFVPKHDTEQAREEVSP